MSKGLVIRNGIKILGTLPSGTGDPLLTLDSTSKEVGSIPTIDTSAYITSALTSAYLLVGNVSNIATPRAITGQVTISNTGVTSITADTITNAHINSGAAITYSKLTLTNSVVNNDIAAAANIARTKLASGTANRVLINNASGVLSEAAAITADRVLISDASGIPVHSTLTTTVLGFVDPTSSIQTQLNNKLSFSSGITPVNGDVLYYTGGAWSNLAIGTAGQVLTVTAGLPSWGTGVANGIPTGGAAGEYLNKVDGTDYNVQWSPLTLAKVTDVTATVAQVNVLATGYYDATSSIQTQIGSKLDRTLNENYLFVGDASNLAVPLASGANGYVLTSVGGVPTWVNLGTGGTVTSISGSGGSTGLTLSGGPISTVGTLTLGGVLIAVNGGTGQSAYVVGDILSANTTTTLSKIAAGTSGYVLTSNGAGVLPSWQVAAGGIGGSTGSTDNTILRANGTGGVTLQSSDIVLSDNADLTLGILASTTGTSRSITAQGTELSISLSLFSKGPAGNVEFTSANNIYANVGTSTSFIVQNSGTNIITSIRSNEISFVNDVDTSAAIISGSIGGTFSSTGRDLVVKGGNGQSLGNTNAGNLVLRGGAGFGTGDNGYVMMDEIPSSDPGVPGAIYHSAGVVMVSL